MIGGSVVSFGQFRVGSCIRSGARQTCNCARGPSPNSFNDMRDGHGGGSPKVSSRGDGGFSKHRILGARSSRNLEGGLPVRAARTTQMIVLRIIVGAFLWLGPVSATKHYSSAASPRSPPSEFARRFRPPQSRASRRRSRWARRSPTTSWPVPTIPRRPTHLTRSALTSPAPHWAVLLIVESRGRATVPARSRGGRAPAVFRNLRGSLRGPAAARAASPICAGLVIGRTGDDHHDLSRSSSSSSSGSGRRHFRDRRHSRA